MNISSWQLSDAVSVEVSDGTTTQDYRLTFKTCSNFDIALFTRRRSKIYAGIVEVYGKEFVSNDEAMALLNTKIAHAIIMAGLKTVEVRDGETWIETKLPDAWYDADRFPYEVPAGTVDPLTDAVFAAGNAPRLFSFLPTGDEEKKTLKINVMPSED